MTLYSGPDCHPWAVVNLTPPPTSIRLIPTPKFSTKIQQQRIQHFFFLIVGFYFTT